MSDPNRTPEPLRRWEHVFVPYRIRPVRGITILTGSAVDKIKRRCKPEDVGRFYVRPFLFGLYISSLKEPRNECI